MVAGHLQEKNDFYYIVLSYKDAAGKRKTKWEATGLSVKRNKKKAEALLLERRRNFMVPTAPAEIRLDDDILFSDFMLKWLEVAKSTIQITTYASYQGMVERVIVPYFRKRGIKLVDLKATDLQDFYNKQLERVKANSVIHYHANIHKALKYAVKIDLIPTNPADKVERPKKNEFKGSYYSADEIHALTEIAEGTKLEIPVLLASFYGLRRSEVLGLKWDAIDFEANTLEVKHIVTQASIDGKKVLVQADRAKTKSSLRTLPLVPPIRDRLLMLKGQQDTYRRLCGKSYNREYLGYLCVDEIGNIIRPNYVSEQFPKLLEKNGLRPIRFHDLRHPYVKHTTKIFSLRLMDFQAQAYPDARRKTRGACQLLRVGQSRSPVRPLCNRKRFSCLPPQSKMSWILYAISMRLSGYTSTRSISSSASSVVSVSASKIALDASMRLSCRACSSCFCFACANTAA